MRRILIELIALVAIGGLIWAAFAIFINFPSEPKLISKEKEQQLGEKYTEVILNLNGFSKIENSKADSIFEETARKLRSVQPAPAYSYTLILVDNSMVNAFALPGGHIIITKGLIEFCQNSEELIAVISHEIGQIEKQHVITRLIKDIGFEILTSGDAYVMGEVARTILSSGYNRKQEVEADEFACELLMQSNLEPRTLASFFRRLKEEQGDYPFEQFEIIASHPNMNNRIKSILAFEVPAEFEPQQPWFTIDELKDLLTEKLND